jgi:hypothetical protein
MTLRFPALVATLATMVGVGAQAADEYQVEVNGGYSITTIDSNPEVESSLLQLEGIYHVLGPVQLGEHAYEEAAFLEHSSFVSARIGRVNLDNGIDDADGFSWGLTGRYAQKEVPVTAQLSIDSFDISDLDTENLTWDLRIGYWIAPNGELGLGYTRSTTDIGAPDDQVDATIYAYGKWVTEINADLDLNLEATFGQINYDDGTIDDDNWVGTAAADVYFQQKYGIGLTLGGETGDANDAEGNSIGVRASAWFTPQIGVRASWETFMAKEDDSDSDTWSLEVAGRF